MVVPIPLWFPSGHLGFLAQSKDMHKVRLLGDSKLAIHDRHEVHKIRIKHCINVWLNVACSQKCFQWSVRLERQYMNTSPYYFMPVLLR